MLTLRGEHFYFVAEHSARYTELICTRRQPGASPRNLPGATASGFSAQRTSPAADGLGNQPAAGGGQPRFCGFSGPCCRWRCSGSRSSSWTPWWPGFRAEAGNLTAHLEARRPGIGAGHWQRCPRPGEHPVRQPAGRPLHQPGQRAADASTPPRWIWPRSRTRSFTTSWSGRAARPPGGWACWLPCSTCARTPSA